MFILIAVTLVQLKLLFAAYRPQHFIGTLALLCLTATIATEIIIRYAAIASPTMETISYMVGVSALIVVLGSMWDAFKKYKAAHGSLLQ